MFRILAERLSRNRVLSRRLKTSGGPRLLAVTPEASLRYWLPGSLNSDSSLQEFSDHYLAAGDRVWDVGANVGVFTFHAAAKVGAAGAVLAVEADPALVTLLLRSVRNCPPADAAPVVLCAAVSDRLSLGDFAIAERSRASNFLTDTGGCSQAGGIRFQHKVFCVTLDWLLDATFAPQVVKMDVEGMELRTLRGAPRLLGEVRPCFHLEVWDDLSAELAALLDAHDYLIFDGEKPLAAGPSGGGCPDTTIAIPREKLEQFRARAEA